MKQLHYWALAALMLVAGVSCAKTGAEEDDKGDNPYKGLNLSTKSAEFAQQGKTFAFELLDRVNQAEKGNYIISPLSMQFLLGMLLDGAQGKTADEICQVLGYVAGEANAVNEYAQALMNQLPDLDKNTKLAIANAVAVNKGYSLLGGYTSDVKQYYEAEISSLDFTDVKGATKKINQWASDHTNGLVPRILDQVDPSAVCYIMDALYFMSEWSTPFPQGKTSKESFTRQDGTQTQVQMMKNTLKTGYWENETMQAVTLVYGNGAFSMTVLLPVPGKNVSDVTAFLKSDNRSIHPARCEVDLWLPKFETNYGITLNSILSDMGMATAFSSLEADFSAMCKNPLFVSFILQKAAIKVEEKGTEAAAVSIAGMYRTAIAPEQTNKAVFHANRPFLYLITETSTGAVLFAGKYSGLNV